MIDKKGYLESIVDNDLQKFIISHLDEDPEKLLEMCVEYLKEGSKDVEN